MLGGGEKRGAVRAAGGAGGLSTHRDEGGHAGEAANVNANAAALAAAATAALVGGRLGCWLVVGVTHVVFLPREEM